MNNDKPCTGIPPVNKPSIKKISDDKFDALSQKSTSMEWDSAHKARQDVLEQEQRRRELLDEEMKDLNQLARLYSDTL